jgi:hypothetical protein
MTNLLENDFDKNLPRALIVSRKVQEPESKVVILPRLKMHEPETDQTLAPDEFDEAKAEVA